MGKPSNSFAGVELTIGLFFDKLFGDLYEKHTPAEVDQMINFANLTPLSQDILESVKRHAVRYATFDRATRQAIAENTERLFWGNA
jgi:hypothetical protein